MPSATGAAKARGGSAGDNLLKGSDLSAKTAKIKIVCVDVREAPDEFNSALIMEIEECLHKTNFALNKTNIKALVSLIDDDYEKWSGWEVELTKYMTRNPSTGKQAWSLSVTGATKLRRKVVRPSTEDDDVPF